ncbi:MAG: hypothetical protein DRI26_02305 [Chloroflexi bacterium]|nr:MAG: hypothetical protein DRI26_02305 [Chloroflexota bacterium]
MTAEGNALRCGECSQVMVRLPWNTKGDVVTCDNSRCGQFRRPQGFIRREAKDMAGVLKRHIGPAVLAEGEEYRPKAG